MYIHIFMYMYVCTDPLNKLSRSNSLSLSDTQQHKQLAVAPPPEPRQLTPGELNKMDRHRNSVLRELRIFLREATNKLLAERKFKEFTRPVDPEVVRSCDIV